MTDHDESLEEIAQRTHQLLARQPLRRAPRTLEQRVWQEIEQRDARSWWHLGFRDWPVGARGVFLVLSAALCALSLDGVASLTHMLLPLRQWRESFLWISGVNAALDSIGRALPAAWLHEALAAAALLYALIFALATAAYRSIYLRAAHGGSGMP